MRDAVIVSLVLGWLIMLFFVHENADQADRFRARVISCERRESFAVAQREKEGEARCRKACKDGCYGTTEARCEVQCDGYYPRPCRTEVGLDICKWPDGSESALDP